MSGPRRSVVAPKPFGNVASSEEIAAEITAGTLPPAPLPPPAPAPVVDHAPLDPPAPGETPAAPTEGEQAGLPQQIPPPAPALAPPVAAAQPQQQVQEEEEEEAESEEDDFTTKRDRSNRPSRAKGVIAKRQGKAAPQRKNAKNPPLLSGIFEAFPLEILYDIFGQLSDIDSLLYLGRLNKTLRSHLFSIKAKPIWERVWARQGFAPLCEESTWKRTWTIPEMVSLMFDTSCLAEGCASKTKGIVDFFTRTRYCIKCAKDIFAVEKYTERVPIIWSLVPSTHSPPGRPRSFKNYAVVEVLDTVRTELLDLFGQDENVVQTEEESAALGALMDEYLQVQVERQAERAKEAIALSCWTQQEHAKVIQARRNQSNIRFDLIISRCMAPPHNICESVLDEAINALPDGLFHSRTALTDRIWNRISPIIFAKVEEIKVQRLQREIDEAEEYEMMMMAEMAARREGGSPS